MQRLVHMSADLARHVGVMLENFQNHITEEVLLMLFKCLFNDDSF